jgi:hypothetical protein
VRHAGAKPEAGDSVAARKGARALFAGRAPGPRELLMTKRDDIPDRRLLTSRTLMPGPTGYALRSKRFFKYVEERKVSP